MSGFFFNVISAHKFQMPRGSGTMTMSNRVCCELRGVRGGGDKINKRNQKALFKLCYF